MDNYLGWEQSLVFRRQVVFTKAGEPSFTAVDFGNFRDGDVDWMTRTDLEITRKIDQHLTSSSVDYATEELAVRIIKHNFDCHKILLSEQQELTSTEAEKEFGLQPGTVRAALGRGVIQGRKAADNIWLVKRGEMKRHYG